MLQASDTGVRAVLDRLRWSFGVQFPELAPSEFVEQVVNCEVLRQEFDALEFELKILEKQRTIRFEDGGVDISPVVCGRIGDTISGEGWIEQDLSGKVWRCALFGRVVHAEVIEHVVVSVTAVSDGCGGGESGCIGSTCINEFVSLKCRTAAGVLSHLLDIVVVGETRQLCLVSACDTQE